MTKVTAKEELVNKEEGNIPHLDVDDDEEDGADVPGTGSRRLFSNTSGSIDDR